MSDVSPSKPIDLIVVGGGAAGLATAIFTARLRPQFNIVVLDGARNIGAKILISGGGRCNVTNVSVTANDFCGGSRHVIQRILNAFPVGQTLAFFREIGVALHPEEHGKLFPDTSSARTVLEALLREIHRRHVNVLPAHRVSAIEKHHDLFRVTTEHGTMLARQVVLATGGRSLPKTGSDGQGYDFASALGHSIVPTTPALVALNLAGDFHAALTGIAHDVVVTVAHGEGRPIRHRGSLLWTHFGVSGPVILDVSRHWHRAAIEAREIVLSVNFLPDTDFTAAEKPFLDAASQAARTSVRALLSNPLPARVADALLRHLNLDGTIPLGHFPRDQRRRLVRAMIDWPLPVMDSRGYRFAEVTAGGVPLTEILPDSMASRRCPGLFLVGEVLDVDGRIGGFNFQWAWSSAWVAAIGLTRGY